jgi:hypothetical protein
VSTSLSRAGSYLRRNAWRLWLSVCAAAFFFAWGLAVGVFEIFPYRLLEAFAAGSSEWIEYPRHNARLRPEKFLKTAREKGAGVVNHVKAQAYPGQTFVTGFFGEGLGMRLFDMEGRMLHEWRTPFNSIWPDAPHLTRKPRDDWDTHIHGAVLYPDGDVIFSFQYGGLARIDKCSRVRWKLPLQTHHSIFVDAEGNLWVPGRTLHEVALAKFPNIPAPFLEETLLKISPDGKVLREISVLDIIYGARYEGVLFANGAHEAKAAVPLDRDFTHLNDIEVLDASIASAYEQFEAGDLLLSLRNLNLLLVVDPETLQIKWSMTGPFVRQHDPDFLPTGRISVFDNRRDSGRGELLGGSLILELDPQTHRVETVYGARAGEFFYTETMGDHQRLPNGNILVTESQAGHAFEVTPEGRQVWSYINRWDASSVAQIERATRYPEGYLAPIQKEDCHERTN